MKRGIRNTTLLAAFAAVIVANTGCSVSGFTTAMISESSKPDQEIVPCSDIKSVRPGTALDITLDDGSTVNGRFMGLVPREGYTSSVERDTFRTLKHSDVPYNSLLVMRVEKDDRNVDMNKVKVIRNDPREWPKFTGLLIGAAAEVAAVLFLAKVVR